MTKKCPYLKVCLYTLKGYEEQFANCLKNQCIAFKKDKCRMFEDVEEKEWEGN